MKTIINDFRLSNGYMVTLWSDGKCVLSRWDNDDVVLERHDLAKLLNIYQAMYDINLANEKI